MLKWIIVAIVILLGAWFVHWQRGATKTSYVNGLAAYSDLPNREFILERDCYVFKLKAADTDFPLIGDHAQVPELPAEVNPANIGADLPGVRILDVARVGDPFKIASVRRNISRTTTTLTFEILFLDEADRKFPRLDAFYLLDHAPEAVGQAPAFLERYAAAHTEK